jgi:glutathione S-transferase
MSLNNKQFKQFKQFQKSMKLYFFPPSPNSRRAHAIALHLNLPIDCKLINLQAGEQRTDDFLALNPTGRIPVLQDGDFILWESNAIMQYLASQAPTPLWPENVQQRADIMRWQSWQMCHWSKGCQPIQFERLVKQLLQLGAPDEQIIQKALETFHREATLLNNH